MASDVNNQRLQAYLDAEKKALVSQEYQDGTQRNRMADLNQIRTGVSSLLASGIGSAPGVRSKRIILRDL